MFFGHDLKLQTGFTETSEPVLIIIPFCLALMRLKVFRVVNPVSRNFEQNFHFRNFRIFHRWPLVGYHGLSVRVMGFACVLVAGVFALFYLQSNSFEFHFVSFNFIMSVIKEANDKDATFIQKFTFQNVFKNRKLTSRNSLPSH